MKNFTATPIFSLIIIPFSICMILNQLSSFPQYASAQTDENALLAFKSMITEDPLMALANWNNSFHFCNWTGVECSSQIPRVTGINLSGAKLSGTLTPHMGNFSFLNLLDLSGNFFQAAIPRELGNLGRLQILNMSSNFLGGQIPADLSNCTNLRNLALDHNFLTGMVPPELGLFSQLKTLYIGSNNLTGTVPSSLGNLTSLGELDMSYNHLIGEVPGTFSKLSNLQTFRLSVNNLSGEFPPSLYNLSSLDFISLSFNRLFGNLRNDIGTLLPNLRRIWLAYNFFTGPIPDSLPNATNLGNIDLARNNFTGGVPLNLARLDLVKLSLGSNQLGHGELNDLNFIASLANCSNLETLDFGNNRFGGNLPVSIANLSTKLTTLHLQGNFIQGSIPVEISNLQNLNTLYMFSNNLKGDIPDSFGTLPNLGRLVLGSNQLTGKIPSSIGNMTHLLWLFLFENMLEGEIPSSLANCTQMVLFSVAQNNLTGTFPHEITSIPSLLSINMSRNSFTGPLPDIIGNMTHLVEIDVSYNKFLGEIPNSIGNCLALNIFWLRENSFGGSVPYLAHLHSLAYLDLSRNNLSGKIPSFLADLPSFLSLNLSFNNLEGDVPSKGVFLNASAADISGNRKLCGGIPELKLPSCPLQEEPLETGTKHGLRGFKLILTIVLTASFASLSFILLLICYIKKKKQKKLLEDRNLTASISSLKFFPKITYEDLLNATNGFSSENMIGSGCFGTVYKGNLIPGGTLVAVKVLNLRQKGAHKSFLSECRALRNIRHYNLIKVITACSSSDFHGNDFKALVYQYMPNGSLDQWLHGDGEGQRCNHNLKILQRINIAIDVAAALNYLHHQCQTSVIHCDLKPQNVLLDTDMTARVGDFGLARLVPKFSKKANVNQFSSLGIKGTIGYASPEYGMGAPISILGDIYSFGILLLEIFTGKRPTDNMFSDNMSLHHYVKMAVPERLAEVLDNSALCEKVTGLAETWKDCWSSLRNEQKMCLKYILQIGVSCSSELPKDRMSMRQVYHELLMIRDAFVDNEIEEELKQSKSLSDKTRGYSEAVQS